jgi:aminoglycoside 6-adenylyltransferase
MSLYERGHLVHLDKTGITAALPPATGATPVPKHPSHAEFDHAIAKFWFEASQVPIYLAAASCG